MSQISKQSLPLVCVDSSTWNKEYVAGRWEYLGKSSSEKSRASLIAMYCGHFFSEGNILDVGCGEGVLYSFLNDAQRSGYLGIDISEVAVKNGQGQTGINAIVCDAATFVPSQKFDIIVFNEVLYYMDYRAILKKYAGFMADQGIIIVSLFRIEGPKMRTALRGIWAECEKLFDSYETLQLACTNKSPALTWDIRVMTLKEPGVQ